jgi:L-iditol 2-dehydrogenase
MLAARLYSARDLRVDEIPAEQPLKKGEVSIKVTSVGICGSDLHTYLDGRIGDTSVREPLIPGHEFAGIVTALGEDCRDGLDQPLRVGQRVAVDPASPCWRCEMCEAGHPNLCRRLHFCGLFPDDGALREFMSVEARSCFPVPDSLTDDTAALLEPFGVAIHAVDLGKLRIADTVAVLGCGPIGLLIIQLAKLSGAAAIFAFDCFDWRLEKAKAWGATHVQRAGDEVASFVHQQTSGRGVDVVFEAAWADQSVNQAVEMARYGGRVVLVGIPSNDLMTMKHSTARRKGLTLIMSRRMKHTYPRAIHLAEDVPLDDLVSHQFSLTDAPHAFALNADYQDHVVKVMIHVHSKD